MKIFEPKIDISQDIFKPRRETKFWIKKAIKYCLKKIQELKLIQPEFLDIFAGSGFIGIFILKNIKNSYVDFVDIDTKALNQIKINLKLNKIPSYRFKIIKSNLFKALNNKKYNFIFANPPYVAEERIWQVQENVKKTEPKISWYGGKEGLEIIRVFLKKAKNYLKKDGEIFMEFDSLQTEKIKEILELENYSEFEFYKDQFRKYRWARILK